ncbi:zona pellucida-like domain-containing protein 1 [Spea bombifrons]|uniref:zona pellucida-like domain-containing protein 1 n=1 Tax=Spea bombifrons TaxID=233779 RepID=UPI00234A7040|nr:zona pellucida-like domain-containing protein 1 [Spea bombifrons]
MVVPSKRAVKQGFFCILIFSFIYRNHCFDISICNDTGTWRPPAYSDILVTCGPQNIELSIYLCPVYNAGYNETLLFMNDIFNNPQCQGVVQTTGGTPFVTYIFSINDSSTCGSSFQITSSQGEGIFSDFSQIETVNISGIIKSKDPSSGVVTYNPELKYLYSCAYPLEYLMNNTRLDVSGNNIAINTNNGSFISTLSLQLFVDSNFSRPLIIPATGIKLKTKVYVEVRAKNLTEKFNVLLDHCYASTSPFPSNSTKYDLFVGCTKDQFTTVLDNGENQYARFSFSAFRFLEQYGQPVSTFYLHCITRLCLTTTCSNFKPVCGRKRREIRAASSSSTSSPISDPATITSTGIITSREDDGSVSKDSSASYADSQDIIRTAVGLGITVGFLALLCTLMGGIVYLMHRRLQKARYPDKNTFH